MWKGDRSAIRGLRHDAPGDWHEGRGEEVKTETEGEIRQGHKLFV